MNKKVLESSYTNELLKRIQSVLKDNLIGLYLIGSSSMQDYIDGKSDIDLFGITKFRLVDSEKDRLENSLSNSSFPCPANGLDIVLMTKNNIKEIEPEPIFEFWYSTGSNWPVEKWSSGKSAEMLLFMELSRQHGITLLGKEASKIINPIDQKLILDTLNQIIEWHKKYILDDYHDPKGQNSVLNVCRILKYVETKVFYSKSDGAKLFLLNEPNNSTVQKALDLRIRESKEELTKDEIIDFIKMAEQRIINLST